MLSLRFPAALLSFAFSRSVVAQTCPTCRSFGIDFKDGASYFQNINSTDPFTAFQGFEGCQNDTAHNILVDPSNNQYECSETPMQPDDQQQLLTCPIDKNELTSGQWSIIILSNNGQCDSINFIRQFGLSVGPQATSKVAATVTITTTSLPIVTTIITKSSTITSTGKAVYTTIPGTNPPQTVTSQPGPKITVIPKGVFTFTDTRTIAQIVATQTSTTTIPCPFRVNAAAAKTIDRVNSKVAVTVGSYTQAAASIKPRAESKQVPDENIARRVRAIIEVRSLEKRHPDQPTTTVFDSALPVVTSTSTRVLSTTTVTGTTTKIFTTTSTPTVTVTKNQPVVTVTVPGKTITNYFWIPYEKTTVTKTIALTATFTSTVTACPTH